MKRTILKCTLLLSVICLIFQSCSTEELLIDDLQGDYLIFGYYNTECWGDGCIQIYAVTEDKLYRDVNNSYRLTNSKFVELDQDLFQVASELLHQIPDQLFSESEGMIYCNGFCYFGGNVIKYVKDGESRMWTIGSAAPPYLVAYNQQIFRKILVINS